VPELVGVRDTCLRGGLARDQLRERKARFGDNRLAEVPPVSSWRRFLAQFTELIVGILLVAAFIAGALGEWIDAVAILAIVLMNGVLSFLQEERAHRELAALRKRSSYTATIVRDGKQLVVPAEELVPGDLVELEAGDHVPADARLIETFAFGVQESALTGESVPVHKDPASLPEVTALADRRNMVYLGTVVVAGRATAIVVATGMRTELGRIAGLLERQPTEPTPLQLRLAELGRKILVVCLVIVATIFLLQMVRGGNPAEIFFVSVSLAVAAIPEGLPAVVTVVLAVGLHRMIHRNALIRKLPSVETLGCVTVICSDKTGTLTRNEMTVERIIAGESAFVVTGIGYTPCGEFVLNGEPVRPQTQADLLAALKAGAYCNRARLTIDEVDGRWQVLGDPTEGALLVVAQKAGIHGELPGRIAHENPFDAERKAMSVIITGDDGSTTMYVKGAPEAILDKCVREQVNGVLRPLDQPRRQILLRQSADLAANALRVLALASRVHSDGPAVDDESDLSFLGLVGMKDPLRVEVREAVRRCYLAGIRPIMITGDHPATAIAIARELGIARPEDVAVSGNSLDDLTDDQLEECVEQYPVFARVTAEHKLRLISALRARHQVVAMTGDGINDAAAVKLADIGIAMGITGTDVTKEAADMVLVDDNFASIVNAVEEGRTIYDNIQKVVHYLLSTNAGEVLLLFITALIGWPLPLTAIQILWINLVSDGLPALALGMEPPEPDIMRRAPRPADQPVITRSHAGLIFLHAILIAAAGVAAYLLVSREPDATLHHVRTATFCTVAFAQLFFSIACRSPRRTMPELGFFSNHYLMAAIIASVVLQVGTVTVPGVRQVFGIDELPTWDWGLIVVIALVPVTIVELAKLLRAWLTRRLHNCPTSSDASSGRRH
jgi:Ca2+-transporting ATPase